VTHTLLEVRGLQRHYQLGPEVVRALDGVDLDLSSGELVAVTGPSGSGKTSLLHVLVGWEQPDEGYVTWAFPTDGSSAWHDLAVLPQRLGLMEEVSIKENVALPARLAPERATEDVPALLAELGLTDLAERLPTEVSLGEQQRSALARALVLRPRVLLADEPTGHQDEGWARTVVAALQRRCGEGMGALVVSHDPQVLERADRVLSMTDGQLDAPADGKAEG
jgi:ABC-type lipoprotein export system ATPase subunit